MFLVHEKKNGVGKWEIAWMWLPHFLALDQELHKKVGKKMTEVFKGTTLSDEPTRRESQVRDMHHQVVNLILEKYPMQGLREYLESIDGLHPDLKIDES